MGRKTEKDILKTRRQRANAVAHGRIVNPEYQREFDKALSKFKKDHPDFLANIEAFKKCINRFRKKWEGKVPTIEDAFLLSSEGQELQKKYGLSVTFLTRQEMGIILSEDKDDWISNIMLKDGGKAVLPLSINNNYLTVQIDLGQPLSTIEAEVKSIVKEFKKMHMEKLNSLPELKFPSALEFKIFEMKKKGQRRVEIVKTLKNELMHLTPSSEGDEDRYRKEFVDRAIKKVKEWIKKTKIT